MSESSPTSGDAQIVESLLQERFSCRGFRPEPVPKQTLERLFAMAQQAPSWCNIQPWRLRCTRGDKTEDLRAELLEAAKSRLPHPDVPFPVNYPEPYATHRKGCGKALYGAMEIERGDKEGRQAAWLRNYELFDAPHLVVVSRDTRLGEYATLDVGVWLGVLFVALQSLGLDACAMASVAAYPDVLRKHLAIGDQETILFGLTLGYCDPELPANRARTERADISDNVTFFGE